LCYPYCSSDENRIPSSPSTPNAGGQHGGGGVRRHSVYDVGGRSPPRPADVGCGRFSRRRRRWTATTAAAKHVEPVTGFRDPFAGDRRRQWRLRRQQRGHDADEQHWPDKLHQQAAHRAGEGVPLQPVPHAGPADRDRVRAAAQRDSGEDMVPEPTDETEETAAGGLAAGGPATAPSTATAAAGDHAPERREQHQ